MAIECEFNYNDAIERLYLTQQIELEDKHALSINFGKNTTQNITEVFNAALDTLNNIESQNAYEKAFKFKLYLQMADIKYVGWPISIKKLRDACYNSKDYDTKILNSYLANDDRIKNQTSFFSPIESEKIAKEKYQKREQQLKLLKKWESIKINLPKPVVLHGLTEIDKNQDIIIKGFSLTAGSKELLADAELKLVNGQVYGLVGRNGVGKSTLLTHLACKNIQGIPSSTHILCVEQEFTNYIGKTPLEIVLEVDEERQRLLLEEKRLLSIEKLSEEDSNALAVVYEKLHLIDADSAEPKACSILNGLGLTNEQIMNTLCQNLNGGARMRVLLARALFVDPSILCLDEPTNHLDINAIAWLTNYINKAKKTFLIVSHNKVFLDDTCNVIIEFSNKKLNYYTGNYTTYETLKFNLERNIEHKIETQNRQKQKLQTFIDKNRTGANTASQAQSKIKLLQKLPKYDAIVKDPTLQYTFANPPNAQGQLLTLRNIYFKYESMENYILKNINLTVNFGDKLGLIGINGCGKSTLLEIICGTLAETDGIIYRNNALNIGYFSQHHMDTLDLTQSATKYLMNRYPKANLTQLQARKYLSNFGITDMSALEPMYILSGGQKSRVVIAIIAFESPNLLVLDEPSNHLDLDAIEALILALNKYKGGVILVSHDVYLISSICDKIYYISNKSKNLVEHKGDIAEYKRMVLQKVEL